MRPDTRREGSKEESPHNANYDTTMRTDTMKEGNKEACAFCNDERHQLAECGLLSAKPYEERILFCRNAGLCFSCLKKCMHIAKDCRRRIKCTKCNRLHPTLLHREWKSYSNNQDSTNSDGRNSRPQPQAAEASANISAETQANQNSTEDENANRDGQQRITSRNIMCSFTDTLPGIIPVIIRSSETHIQLKTYAMIDSGSNAVFCTDELTRELKVKGKKTNIHMSTMTDEKVVASQIINNLEIMDLQEHNNIQLPVVYTQEQIPVSKEDIPRPGDLTTWPYLQHIELPPSDEDVHVGLLIGSNVPRAMEPIDVINSDIPNGPFACKTALGWIVYGATKNHTKQGTVQSHRVKARANMMPGNA